LPKGGATATWIGAGSCNHVALLNGSSSQSFWIKVKTDAQFVDIGFCLPGINLNISGPSDWMGYQSGMAWIYRASGAYQTAAPPPGQGIAYGAAYGMNDIVTATRLSDTQIEFVLNGVSQGVITLGSPGIPATVVGCADVCSLSGSYDTLSTVSGAIGS
jgi:hypothetical protein